MTIKILDAPYQLSLLADLGKPTTAQPKVSQLVLDVYESMFDEVISGVLAKEKTAVKTRIYTKDKRAVFKGEVIKKKQKVVVADVMRAGAQPANLYYLKLCSLLDPKYVRQDHIMAQRVETGGKVQGTNLMGSKIGGSVKGATVIIPDPMGATGGSLTEVINFYEKNYGPAKQYVAVHLVITPQYLEQVKKLKVKLAVYAARQDDGLTKDDFIYPGLGGVGEMINNTKK